jgi:hypothetical protein
MIKFFRKIRKQLLTENKFSKYLLYAIGEILLVVIGIIIAVSIGEWRQQIREKNEVTILYKNLKYELNQDKIRLDTLILKYEKSSVALANEIRKIQLDSYNQDSLYNGFADWMLYTTSNQFVPQESVYTEMISNGKLQLVSNNMLKSKMLKLYNELYSKISIRRTQNSSMLMEFSTLEVSDSFRWLNAFNNDKIESNDINFKSPPLRWNHNWLKNKQSDKYRRFENSLSMRHAIYIGNISLFYAIKDEIEKLESLLNNELTKNE